MGLSLNMWAKTIMPMMCKHLEHHFVRRNISAGRVIGRGRGSHRHCRRRRRGGSSSGGGGGGGLGGSGGGGGGGGRLFCGVVSAGRGGIQSRIQGRQLHRFYAICSCIS